VPNLALSQQWRPGECAFGYELRRISAPCSANISVKWRTSSYVRNRNLILIDSAKPTAKPTVKPTVKPSFKPSAKPSYQPTSRPTSRWVQISITPDSRTTTTISYWLLDCIAVFTHHIRKPYFPYISLFLYFFHPLFLPISLISVTSVSLSSSFSPSGPHHAHLVVLHRELLRLCYDMTRHDMLWHCVIPQCNMTQFDFMSFDCFVNMTCRACCRFTSCIRLSSDITLTS
jgi:PT repeat